MSSSLYATPTDFAAFGLKAAAVAGYTSDQITAFLQIASNVADGYLRSRQSLPLITWGQDLRIAVCQIAALIILTHRGFDPSNPADAAIVNADKNARDWLADASRGVVALEVVDTAPAPTFQAEVTSRPSRGW